MSDSVVPDVVRVQVPFAIRKRGGRKLVLVPGGNDAILDRPRVDNAMIKGLARAFRWRKLLETGVYGTIEELAAAEEINASYVSRVLRLTLLAPNIVETILDGRHAPELTLSRMMKPFPAEWEKQEWARSYHQPSSTAPAPSGLKR
jgi:hypothetical protein